MEKQQLIEYLSAVCDAESAAESCRENIAEIQRQKSMVKNVSKPSEPYYQVASSIKGESFSNILITATIERFAANAGIAFAIFFIIYYVNLMTTPSFGALFLVFLAVCVGQFLYQMNKETTKKEQLQRAEDIRVKNENQRAKAEYNLALYAYEKEDEVHTKALLSLNTAIEEQEKLLAGATQRIEMLYGMGILHTSCRNIIAAYQIREYLEMGICDTLEGPNGAYKQYQFDVLAQRVCTSIDDMKKAVVSAVQTMQSTLVGELRLMNHNVQEMGNMLHSDFQAINATIGIEQAKNRAQIDAGFQQANTHLSSIEKNLSIAVHNDYIQKRISNVDTYLLKAPDGMW